MELSVASYERALNVQLWKEYVDVFRITLIAPGGERQEIETRQTGTVRLTMGQTELLIILPFGFPINILFRKSPHKNHK